MCIHSVYTFVEWHGSGCARVCARASVCVVSLTSRRATLSTWAVCGAKCRHVTIEKNYQNLEKCVILGRLVSLVT